MPLRRCHGLQCAAGKFLALLTLSILTASWEVHTEYSAVETSSPVQVSGVDGVAVGEGSGGGAHAGSLSFVEDITSFMAEVRNLTGAEETRVDEKGKEGHLADRKQVAQRLSAKLLPVVTKVLKQVMRVLPEKDFLKKGIDKLLFTFWEPVLMLSKMAYIAWLPAVAGVLSLVSNNSIIAGVVFLMIIASALQKKALLAEAAAGAVSRRSLAPTQQKRSPRRQPRGLHQTFEPQLPKIVWEMSKWHSTYH